MDSISKKTETGLVLIGSQRREDANVTFASMRTATGSGCQRREGDKDGIISDFQEEERPRRN